ncbi:MAG TPA: ATP-binding protein [Ktedonobacterales bacterium]|nr:ATP-binding protein [Ktedonobacterales bacterium]
MRSLTWKLGLAFLIVSITGALVAGIFVWQATQQGFQDVARSHAESDFVTQMSSYYQNHGSWEGIQEYMSQPQTGPDSPEHGPPPSFCLVDQKGMVLLSNHNHQPGQYVPANQRTNALPVKVNGKVVGTVFSDGPPPALSPSDQQFLASTEHALIFGSLAAFLLALALGIFLARSLTRPVREITTALHAMAGGELQQAVPVRSQDELGELSAAFNQMSADLAYANQQRRQMTADIAHDLRTPVTVIAGYLEALRDGVLPSTPERFAILYEESQHLQALIEDLRTLSLADAGELVLHPQAITPHALLQRIAETYQHSAEQQEISLQVQAPDDLPAMQVDVDRMIQVLRNLVSNALRYTPAAGTITLGAEHDTQGTTLFVRDTGQGIVPQALPRIFDRFYRADASRAQSQGESGLGLAIAKALVEAHGGTIGVTSQPGEGTAFRIQLPDEKDTTC